MAEAHVKGPAELNKFMQELPVKIERNVSRGAMRAAMNTTKPVAQSNIHSISGELARGLKVGTRARGAWVVANLKATGPHRSIAHLVEFGTKAHNISARRNGWLSFMNIFRKEVRHPGARPKAFMRPALDATANSGLVAAAEYTKKRLATKHGLDTSHIMIEGDE